MNHVLSRVASLAAHRSGSAALVGVLMSVVVWMLSCNEEHAALNLVLALVVVLCGTTSFVLFALHRLEQNGRPTLARRFAEARYAAIALGGTLALALLAIQACAR